MDQPRQSQYRQLIEKTKPAPGSRKTAEGELDRLLGVLEEKRRTDVKAPAKAKRDPVQILRDMTVREFVPIFVELVEKYSPVGIAMHMDASNLLEGGHELHFEFRLGQVRIELQGTVTSDAIAFHEVRHLPNVDGHLVAGPMLRLKSITAQTFREFVCSRLATLIRLATR